MAGKTTSYHLPSKGKGHKLGYRAATLKLLFASVFFCCFKAEAQSKVYTLYKSQSQDSTIAFIQRIDKNFTSDWSLDSIRFRPLDHNLDGYIIFVHKKVDSLTHERYYCFDTNSNFRSTHERRYLNDTLFSYGDISYKNNAIDYIEQFIPDRNSMVQDEHGWRPTKNLEYCNYEIYDGATLYCIYQVKHPHVLQRAMSLRDYPSLYHFLIKEKARLIQGKDCLQLFKDCP